MDGYIYESHGTDPYYVNPNSLQFNTEIHEPDRSSNRARHDHVGFGSHLTTKTPVMSPWVFTGGRGYCVWFLRLFLCVFVGVPTGGFLLGKSVGRWS